MIRVLAYAKINLSLTVLRRREDGFHDIDSLIQTIDLADEITVERTDNSLHVENDLGIPAQEDLVWKAARLIFDEKEAAYGMRISVHKRIPTGAGLGGGSSDAAAVLWAVDRLSPPTLPHERLLALGAQLGSDVPLFFYGGLVRATGRGESIAVIIPPRREWFVLIVPPVHCNTTSVYHEMRERIGPNQKGAHVPPLGANDLYEAAIFLYPELVLYARAIEKLKGEYSGMSGSGSAFFVAFNDKKAAADASIKMEETFPQARVYLTRGTTTGFRTRGEG